MFSDLFVKLLQKKNVTAYQLAKKTGISNGLLSDYKTGAKKPSSENLKKIANYFNVTTDYLLGKTEPTQEDEITFDDFTYAMHNETKNLTEEDKQALLDMAKIFKKRLDKER